MLRLFAFLTRLTFAVIVQSSVCVLEGGTAGSSAQFKAVAPNCIFHHHALAIKKIKNELTVKKKTTTKGKP